MNIKSTKEQNFERNVDMMLYLIFVGNVTKCKPAKVKKEISARPKKPSNTLIYEYKRVQNGFKSYETLKKEKV